jgi:hypothetical protein
MVARRRGHPWLFPGGELQPWLDALRLIDGCGDKAQLVKLLTSNVAIPAEARQHLADLLERYQLKLQRGGRGGRRTPSYDLPHHVVQLDAAVRIVRGGSKQERRGLMPSSSP